jgi:predicted ArsR family transcriptional regulator
VTRAGPEPGLLHALTGSQRDVLAVLRKMGGPATVDEVATELGLHPNTTREHLEALRGVGRVERTAEAPRGRGRPAYRYAAVPGEGAAGQLYVGLVDVLADHLARTSPDPVGVAVDAGRSWSRALGDVGGAGRSATPRAARRRVVSDLAALGFAPQADSRDTVVRLRECPVLDAARRHPDIVCAVHAGLAQGLLERAGGDPARARLTPFAAPGWCRLELAAPPPRT